MGWFRARDPVESLGFTNRFQSNKGITLNRSRVSRWKSMLDDIFCEQTTMLCQPTYSNKRISFNGPEKSLEVRGFYSPSGPHTFIMLMDLKSLEGKIFESQGNIGLVTIPASSLVIGLHVFIIEIMDETLVINGESRFGSDWKGIDDYSNFDLLAWLYKPGLLNDDQRAQLLRHFNAKGYTSHHEISIV